LRIGYRQNVPRNRAIKEMAPHLAFGNGISFGKWFFEAFEIETTIVKSRLTSNRAAGVKRFIAPCPKV